MLRPLLMMRTRGLGVHFQKTANLRNHIARALGSWHSSQGGVILDPVDFAAAYRALDTTQNVNVEGDICNLMPRGIVGATSIHNAPILAPDADGIYQEYGVNVPVWKRNRLTGGIPYATDLGDVDLVPHPFLQCNEAATNLTYPGFGTSNTAAVTPGYGDGRVGQTVLLEDNGSTLGIIDSPVVAATNATYRIPIRKQLSYVSTLRVKYVPNLKRIQINLVSGETYDLDAGNTAVTWELEDFNSDWWILYLHDLANRADYSLEFFPAVHSNQGDIIAPTDNSATGSMEIDNIDLFSNTTIAEMKLKPPILATTAEASIPKLEYTYPAANNPDPANAEIKVTLDYAGEATGNVLDIGGLLTLKYITSNLTLSDGTNSVAVPITVGHRAITMTLTPTQMTLDVDGVSDTGAYTPVASGLITVEEDHWGLNRKPGVA